MNGNFDFWAYRLDDANYKYETTYKTFAPASAATEGYEAYKKDGENVYAETAVEGVSVVSDQWVKASDNTEKNYTNQVFVKTTKVDNEGPQLITSDDINTAKITIPLVIDGTQDVMAAQTALTRQDTVTLVEPLLTLEDADEDGSLIKDLADNSAAQKRFDSYAKSLYSAKTARKGVQPNLVFSHLLTRFTFDAKAYKKDFAENNADEIRITKIVVYSKTSGNIVAQYKAVNITDPRLPEYKVSKGQDYAIESTLEVDATEKAKPLSLMARIEGENSKLVGLTDTDAPGQSRVA